MSTFLSPGHARAGRGAEVSVERIRAAVAGPESAFSTSPAADHAFDNPDVVTHHPEASSIAWGLTRTFLSRHLPVR